MNINDFRVLLKSVDRSYDDYVSAVISYIKMPGNMCKMQEISSYIRNNPGINSSDVLKLIVQDISSKNIKEEILSA